MTENRSLNVVIPMAGYGSRFASAGYAMPKPLIDVAGKPMVVRVIDNLRPPEGSNFIFIVLKEHLECYPVRSVLESAAPGCEIIALEAVSRGAAETVLAAQAALGGAPLVIANSDQFVDADLRPFYDALNEADGAILTMASNDPKWSYVEVENGKVKRVVEKEVVSSEATVGIYGYTDGADFVRVAQKMIDRGETSKGEFYVAPTYTYLAAEGQDLRLVSIGSDREGMHGLGTPEDLEAFLNSPAARRLSKS